MWMRAAALIEGLRLEDPITLEPLVVTPVSPDRKFIGRDGRGIFNAELAPDNARACGTSVRHLL